MSPGGLYALGQKDEFNGTGVFSFIKMKRKPSDAPKVPEPKKKQSDSRVTMPRKEGAPKQEMGSKK